MKNTKIKHKIILMFIILILILFISNTVNALTIVLDPGHGGKQPGAVNSGIQEKDVTLKIANYLKTYLEQYQDVKVELTHNGLAATEELDIFDRGVYPRKIGADLLISLHINSSTSSSANGAEVYITANESLLKYNYQSKLLGNAILNNIINLGIKSNRSKN